MVLRRRGARTVRTQRTRGLTRIRYGPIDRLFSRVVRARDKTCQFKFLCRGAPVREAAHLIKRNRWSVRWDEDCAVGSCWQCHRFADEHRTELEAFAMKHLGAERYSRLLVRSSLTEKAAGVDRAAVKAYLKRRLMELGA